MNSNWSINRIVALVIGIVFTIVGIIGFFYTPTMTPNAIFGLFGVDLVHNLVHLVIGILGIVAAYTGWSRRYNQIFGIIYLLLGIAGLIPGLYFVTAGHNRLLGLTYINDADNVLHLVVGIVQIAVGFFVHERNIGNDPYRPTPTV